MQYISHINVAPFFFEGKHRIAALWLKTRQFPGNRTKRAKTRPFHRANTSTRHQGHTARRNGRERGLLYLNIY